MGLIKKIKNVIDNDETEYIGRNLSMIRLYDEDLELIGVQIYNRNTRKIKNFMIKFDYTGDKQDKSNPFFGYAVARILYDKIFYNETKYGLD